METETDKAIRKCEEWEEQNKPSLRKELRKVFKDIINISTDGLVESPFQDILSLSP